MPASDALHGQSGWHGWVKETRPAFLLTQAVATRVWRLGPLSVAPACLQRCFACPRPARGAWLQEIGSQHAFLSARSPNLAER